MADNLHNALAQFRDTMLNAVARLEFTLRDQVVESRLPNYLANPNATWIPNSSLGAMAANQDDASSVSFEESEQFQILTNTLDGLLRRVQALESREARSNPAARVLGATSNVLEVNDMSGILEMRPPTGSRNIIVASVHATPALAAAVAAANPPDLNISTGDSATTASQDQEVVEEAEQEVEEEEEAEVVEEEEEAEVVEEEEDEPDLRPAKYKGQQYFVDADNCLYTETDEGYEEVGKWDPQSCTPSFFGAEEEEAEEEEVEEEAEDEEAVEVEEFEYKGKTYQRDSENNVYLDGEQIGTWNGKKILPMA